MDVLCVLCLHTEGQAPVINDIIQLRQRVCKCVCAALALPISYTHYSNTHFIVNKDMLFWFE